LEWSIHFSAFLVDLDGADPWQSRARRHPRLRAVSNVVRADLIMMTLGGRTLYTRTIGRSEARLMGDPHRASASTHARWKMEISCAGRTVEAAGSGHSPAAMSWSLF
jgi:hypothetical protein